MEHRRAMRFLVQLMAPADSRPGSPFQLDLPSGPVLADVYRPASSGRGTVIAIHSMTLRAHRDPRLIAACRALASTGLQVVAPCVETLATLSLTADASVRIRELVTAVGSSAQLGRPTRVGLLASSFAGGQALAAAAHPDVRDRITALLLVGAYADAATMLRHVMSTPGSNAYGRLVVLRRFLAATGEENLRSLVELALADESLRREDPLLPTLLVGLDPARLGRFLALRDDPEVGAQLAARILSEQSEAVRALSVVEAIPDVRAPVTLVHGRSDPVIPASESERIQRLLHASGRTCRLCTTRLLDHGDISLHSRSLFDLPSVVRVVGHWFATLDG